MNKIYNLIINLMKTADLADRKDLKQISESLDKIAFESGKLIKKSFGFNVPQQSNGFQGAQQTQQQPQQQPQQPVNEFQRIHAFIERCGQDIFSLQELFQNDPQTREAMINALGYLNGLDQAFTQIERAYNYLAENPNANQNVPTNQQAPNYSTAQQQQIYNSLSPEQKQIYDRLTPDQKATVNMYGQEARTLNNQWGGQ